MVVISRNIVVVAVATVILTLTSVGNAKVNEDGDLQFWTHEVGMMKITDNVTGTFDAMFRFGDDMSDFWYQHYDAGVLFKVSKWLSIKPSYRIKMINLDSFDGDKWLNINNPSLNFIFSHKLGKTKLKNNCRFSYWNYDEDFNRKDLLYYRNIFMVFAPWSWTSAKIKPYVREDFFFNCDINEVDRNRLSLGLLSNKSKHVTPSIYMMVQSYNHAKNGWTD
ncbi:MAG: DUF2490 domain-containing protein, partial [Kiritimatiellae bacterium]|nr:DUF2490 domain-containing protein [Kiritimatiellia bacterium]